MAADQTRLRMDRVHPSVRIAPVRPDMGERDSDVTRGSDEDLKMLALNSLLNRDPATALPLLRGILSGNQPLRVKKHALFVLAQSKSPEAEGILHDAALGKLDPQLQEQAIQAMAVFQGKRANDTLAEVYRTTTDPKIKRSIISAMFITKDAPRMVEMARNEKDLELKRHIVSELALMNDKAATDYMMELLK
jgi:HEAT repeat protein